MPVDRCPRCTFLFEIGEGWRVIKVGSPCRGRRNMKTLASGMLRLGRVRLAGQGPRDPLKRRLETRHDVVKCCGQSRPSIRNVSPYDIRSRICHSSSYNTAS